MKGNRILDNLGQVDEKYIEEAAPVTRQHKKKNGWVKWGVTAACLAFAVYAGTRLIPLEAPGDGSEQPSSVYESQQAEPDEPSTSAGNPNSEAELPMLTIAQLTNEGMGFEGYMAHDISELVNGNPWNESVELSALPVYANQLEYDSRFIVRGDREAMKKMLEESKNITWLDTTVKIMSAVKQENVEQIEAMAKELC